MIPGVLPDYFKSSSQFFYIIVDKNGFFKHANPAFKNKFIWDAGELSQKSFFEQTFPLHLPLCINAFQKVTVGNDEIVLYEQRIKAASGHYFIINWELSIIPEKDSLVKLVQGIGVENKGQNKPAFKSISFNNGRGEVEKILFESEKRFRDVADSVPVMIWMSDTRDELTYVNKAWVDFTGIKPEMLKHNSWESLIHPDDVEGIVKESNNAFTMKLPGASPLGILEEPQLF